MIIGIDWNSTVQDQISEIIRQSQVKFGVDLAIDNFGVWDAPLGHLVGIPDEEFTRWAWTSPEIQEQAQPYPFAREIIGWLYKRHTVKIITSTNCPQVPEKWLEAHRIRYHELVITKDKNAVEWDILIDDNPVTLAALHPERYVIRYDLPWNRISSLSGIQAINGWTPALISMLQNHRAERLNARDYTFSEMREMRELNEFLKKG